MLIGSRMRFGCAVLLALVLVACDGEPQRQDDTMSLQAPALISDSRAVELEQLSATVMLDDGREITMARRDNNTWTAIVTLPPDTQQTITIEWSERFKGRDLKLASASREITVGTTAESFNLSDLVYGSEFDRDDDGKTNLAERQNGTDPFAKPTPGQPDVNIIIPRVATTDAPTIDGQGVIYDANAFRLVGEWATAVQQDQLNDTLYIENLMIDINSDQNDGEPFHRWAAVHDGTWLYVLAVSDDIGQYGSDSSDTPQDDNLEIYFDGNNSKNSQYGEPDDISIHVPLLELDSQIANNHLSATGRISAGFNSAPIPADVEYAVGLGTGPLSLRGSSARQDVYEVRVKIADLGITFGEPFGIEIQLDDDDDGDRRDSKWGWFHRSRTTEDTDTSWLNPSVMGTALLE